MDCSSNTSVIEKYTRNTRFCLICNYINKIIPALQVCISLFGVCQPRIDFIALQSRCTRFRFAPLKKELVLPRLQYVIKEEGYPIYNIQHSCSS